MDVRVHDTAALLLQSFSFLLFGTFVSTWSSFLSAQSLCPSWLPSRQMCTAARLAPPRWASWPRHPSFSRAQGPPATLPRACGLDALRTGGCDEQLDWTRTEIRCEVHNEWNRTRLVVETRCGPSDDTIDAWEMRSWTWWQVGGIEKD